MNAAPLKSTPGASRPPARLSLLQKAIIVMMAAGLAGCPQKTPRLVTYSDPLTAEERATLGAIYEREGDHERALQEYRAALKKDPQNLVALTGLGNIALHNQNPRLAIRYYREALKLDPDNIAILNNLALAYLEAENQKKAIEAAERAAALDQGRDPRVIETLARARLAVGDRQGAIAALTLAKARCQELCGTAFDRGKPAEQAEKKEPTCDPDMAAACREINEKLSMHGEQSR